MSLAQIYIIHENDEWTRNVTRCLDKKNVHYQLWNLSEGILDLTQSPPQGVFYNRMSASSHTRGHRYSPEFTQQVIKWLEFHERKVINGSGAIDLEISKIKQYLQLEKLGIKTPKTVAVLGKHRIIEAARQLNIYPIISKHNRAGKGLGVRLFRNEAELAAHVNSEAFEPSVDGITLLQEYIKPHDGRIRRSEFIGGDFFYTVAVDSSDGFELCPADACNIDFNQSAPCSIDGKFKIIDPLPADRQTAYASFLKAAGIAVAAIEWVQDDDGRVYVYDVNTNTNYNSEAEARANLFANERLADYLQQALKELPKA